MVTDDNRIRIAKKLREYDPTDKCWCGVYSGFDYYLFMDEFFEAIELPYKQDNWCEYLAELIEPNHI